MALRQNRDPVTGLELEGLYYRIVYHNINDTDMQVTVDVYASEQAYKDNARSLFPSRFYTFPMNKEEYANSRPYNYMYALLKTHEDFKDAEDVLEDEQKPE